MTAKQVQIRRDTATNLNAATPAAGELGWDTTNERLVSGNGSTAGGIRHASAKDVQNNRFTYGTVGGTANAITLTNSQSPVTSYAAGQEFTFKATNTNSSTTTANVDGLGTKNIYKLSNGSLVALSGSEIVSGVIYTIAYDGTQFQLKASGGGGVVIVHQPFTATGTYTPTAGMLYCIVEAVGGGGGGGSGVPGAGGGGGEYARSRLTAADIGASKAVTIGAGGSGGRASTVTNPTAGGDTSLGSLVIAKGGTEGTNRSGSDVTGGNGGTGGTGDFKIPGQTGGAGSSLNGNSGAGGNSHFGFGGVGVLSGAGAAGSGYGAGGSGSQANANFGGAGSAGYILITEYCSG